MRRPAAAALCLVAVLAGCGSRVELPAAVPTPEAAPTAVAPVPQDEPEPAPVLAEARPEAPAAPLEPSPSPPRAQAVQPSPADPGAALRGRTFVSTSVEEDGRPRPLLDGTALRLTVEPRGAADTLRWSAGCNTMGADVRITTAVLDVEPVGSTAAGCDDARHAQDDWVTELLRSDPQWELADGVLTLRRAGTVVRLQESRD